MTFGLTEAPASFQTFIGVVITPEMRPDVFCYLDDILVVTGTFIEKSKFCCSEMRYLGMLVNKNGLYPDPEKIAPIVS